MTPSSYALELDTGAQLLAAIVGVLSSVLASIVWLVMLRLIRPRIDVSPIIVEETSQNGEIQYRIKMINRSKRALVDVSFEISIMRPERTRGGLIYKRKVVRSAGPPPLIIPGRDKNGDFQNSYRIRVVADLRKVLEEDEHKFIRLRILARDEVSGIGRVFEQTYHEPKSDIVPGKYAKGDTFEVV